MLRSYDSADVAVVDDDPVARTIVVRFLEAMRVPQGNGTVRALRVWATGDGEQLTRWVVEEKRTFAVVFLDYMLGAGSRSGRDIVAVLRREGYSGMLCILTGSQLTYNRRLRVHLEGSGADRILVKTDAGLRDTMCRIVSNNVVANPVFREPTVLG